MVPRVQKFLLTVALLCNTSADYSSYAFCHNKKKLWTYVRQQAIPLVWVPVFAPTVLSLFLFDTVHDSNACLKGIFLP